MRIVLPPILQSLTGGGSDAINIKFSEVPHMQTLPMTFSIICAVGSLAGACAKIALENRKAARPSRENWTGFFVSVVFGLPVSLGGGEYLFHTQKWARESIWWLLMLSVVVGYNGLMIALETPAIVRLTLSRLVGAQGKKP